MQQEARRRAPAAARRERLRLVALTGTTAYSIAVFSCTDNRTSTYLLAYTTLPLLLTAAPWLSMILARRRGSRAASAWPPSHSACRWRR